MMKPITDRVLVFLFGILVALIGLINPDKALKSVAQSLGKE